MSRKKKKKKSKRTASVLPLASGAAGYGLGELIAEKIMKGRRAGKIGGAVLGTLAGTELGRGLAKISTIVPSTGLRSQGAPALGGATSAIKMIGKGQPKMNSKPTMPKGFKKTSSAESMMTESQEALIEKLDAGVVARGK